MTAVEAAHEPVVIDIAADLPARVAGLPIDPATTVSHLEAVGCEVAACRRPPRRDPADVAPRPDRPDRPRRGGPAPRRLRRDPVDPADRARPARAGPTSGACVAGSALALAGAGYVEVLPTRSSATPISTLCSCPRTTDAAGRPAGESAERGAAVPAHHAAAGTARHRPAQPRAADRRPSRSSRRGRRLRDARELGGQPSRGPDVAAPQRRSWPRSTCCFRSSRGTSRWSCCGDREPAGWWGAGRPARGPTRSPPPRRWAGRPVSRIDVRPRRRPRVPPRSVCCPVSCPSGETVIGHAGELHPRVIEAFGLPTRTSAMELDLDALVLAAPDVGPGARDQHHAGGQGGRRPGGRPRGPGRRGGRRAALRRRRARSSPSGCSTSTPVSRWRRASKSLAFALRFRAPDRTLSADEVTAAREAAVAAAAERAARCCAPDRAVPALTSRRRSTLPVSLRGSVVDDHLARPLVAGQVLVGEERHALRQPGPVGLRRRDDVDATTRWP